MTVNDMHPAFLGTKVPIFKCVILFWKKNMYVTKEKVAEKSFSLAQCIRGMTNHINSTTFEINMGLAEIGGLSS